MLNVIPARLLRSGLFCALAALTVLPASAANQFVGSSGELQGALNQAQAGDTITLAAGVSFFGNFTLPPNDSGQWITIQSSAMSSLPGVGTRVSPTQSQFMPKIVTPNAGAALVIPSGANYYWIQGVEFAVAPGVYVNDLIEVGTVTESSISQLPHHVVFDRNYIHGDPNSGGKRGLALNGATVTVENSYFEAFTSDWQDTQAICGWNGSGPFTITNNHLEAGGEIVAFGGARPSIPGLIPSNIIVSNNDFYKPMSWWYGGPNYIGRNIRAKNHFELKNAKNVIVQNNTFSNNFVGADQLGFMVVLNVRDEVGTVPWATVSNVTVKNNLFQHTAAGVLFMGHDGDGGGTAGNFSFSNNTWLDMGGYGGDGRMYEILNDVRGITIDHETAFPTGWLMVFAQGPSSGVQVTNSILTSGWGIACEGYGTGEPAMSNCNPNGFFANNAVISGWTSGFTGTHFGTNLFPGSIDAVGFMNFTGNDVQLAANSALKGQGTDGLDLGSNLNTQSNVLTTNATNALGTQDSTYNTLVPNGWVSIVSKQSGKCMDLASWSGTNWGQNPVAPVAQWDCWGGDMQKMRFAPVYDGYKITIKLSGQQFDIAGGTGAISPGTPLVQFPYWGGANEIFQLSSSADSYTALGDGYVTLHPIHTGMCLAVMDDSQENGAAIVQEPCTGTDDQRWKLVPAQ